MVIRTEWMCNTEQIKADCRKAGLDARDVHRTSGLWCTVTLADGTRRKVIDGERITSEKPSQP